MGQVARTMLELGSAQGLAEGQVSAAALVCIRCRASRRMRPRSPMAPGRACGSCSTVNQ